MQPIRHFFTTINLIADANANASSQFNDQEPARLTDGNAAPGAPPVGTNSETSPWVQIDLGEIRCIDHILAYMSNGILFFNLII